MKFGEVLRNIRLSRNLTQQEMAELLSTSKQVLSRYENGLRVPKLSVAARYADILGVPLPALVGEDAVPFLRDETRDRIFDALLDMCGFLQSCDEDANVTIYREGLSVNRTPELVAEVMDEVQEYFMFQLSRRRL